MRPAEEREREDARIRRGVDTGDLDSRAQRVQRAQRSMHRVNEAASVYSDPWIEQEEVAASRPIPSATRPPPPSRPKKPLLTERQQNVVFEALFGQAAPMAQTAFEMAQSETGQKVIGVGGLALGAMLFPLVGGLRR